MSRKFVVTLLVLAVPVIAAAQTRVDLDRHKDFSQYKTFTLEVEPAIRADGVVDEYNTLAGKRLRQAVTRELQARGLEATDAVADLTVRVSSRETERTAVMDPGWGAYPYPYWSWSRRWAFRGGPGYWGPWGPYAGDVWPHRYLEESVTMDMIEAGTGELVYRAQVTGEIGNDRDKQAIKIVEKAFKKFPVKEVARDEDRR
jgi:hypothetical protein